MDRPSAIQKASFRDRAAFIASPRRAIRVRAASVDEKAAAGLPIDAAAETILVILCKQTIKIVVAERQLAGDVTAAADAISKADGRPLLEVLDAAHCFPLIASDDLAVLGHRMMEVRPKCARCTCAAGYAPLVIALAQAAAQANSKPWTISGLTQHFEQIKAATPGPLITTAPGVRTIADAIRTIIQAAGYVPHEP